MRSVWGMAVVLGLALALPVGSAAVEDDDLAVVKRATKQEPPSGGGLDREEPAAKERPVVRRSGKPQWLRVRVVEKSGRKKISVNLPLALVRALGDDFDLGALLCGRQRGSHHRDQDQKDSCPEVRLADVLAALESGEDLVQVDEEDATVRVWVE